jgi:hypothetical protein
METSVLPGEISTMKTIGLQIVCALAWLTMTAAPPQNPPKSSAPDLEIVSAKWTKVATGTVLDPGGPGQTIQREGKANDPMPVVVPNPTITRKVRGLTYYVYSARIINHGKKEIKGLAWDYVFKDQTTHEELKRQSGSSAVEVRHNQKTTVKIFSASSPPKTIDASAIGKGRSPFEEQVVIQCVLFADGLMWANPQAPTDSCERERPSLKSRLGSRPIFW